jgi:hypothetical protein
LREYQGMQKFIEYLHRDFVVPLVTRVGFVEEYDIQMLK